LRFIFSETGNSQCEKGCDGFDATALEIPDDIADGAGVLLDERRNFRRKLSTGMKPKDF